jgi:hypothetical protein
VHATDSERIWGTAPARYSRAYSSFHRLDHCSQLPALWRTLHSQVDMIIPFNQLSSHMRSALQDVGATVLGERLFDDDIEFADFVRDNVISRSDAMGSVVKVAASFVVRDRAEIAEILGAYSQTTFSLQPGPYVEVEHDFDDGDTLVGVESPTGSKRSSMAFGEEEDKPLVISCATLSDGMVEAIEELPISEVRSYRMMEIVDGGVEYAAHAFVNAGKMRTFIVTGEQGVGHDVAVVTASHPLYKIFYEFSARFIDALDSRRRDSLFGETWKEEERSYTGHVSLRFRVKDEIRENGDFVWKVTVTGCTNMPDISLVLQCSTASARARIAMAYTQPIPPSKASCQAIFPPERVAWGLYAAPTVARAFAQVASRFAPCNRHWWAALSHVIIMCCVKVFCHKEEVWDLRDPGPALCVWIVLLVEGVCRRYKMRRSVESVIYNHVSDTSAKGALTHHLRVPDHRKTHCSTHLDPASGIKKRRTLRTSDRIVL